jgi:hypothetical protein
VGREDAGEANGFDPGDEVLRQAHDALDPFL